MTATDFSREPEIWGKVPQRNMNFTGRGDLLERLREGLRSDVTAVLPDQDQGHVPRTLHGLGGVGKTQLVIEYAHRFKHEYDLVWWIPADQTMLMKSALAGLASRLRLPVAPSLGVEAVTTAVLDALRRGEPYSRWLLIFDNADAPEDIEDVIPHGPGHVLITSRNHRWQGVVDTISVDVFERDESIEFLLKRVRRGISRDQAGQLADALGNLPLALEQAGALQVETGMPAEEYLRLLEERVTELLAVSKPSDYPHSMTAAWSISVAQLRERMPEAVDLLRACAFFGPEPIPRNVFRQLPAEYAASSRFTRMLTNTIQVSRAIGELGRYALARIDSPDDRNQGPDRPRHTIQVHRLVQALLRDEIAREEWPGWRHEVHLLLAAAAHRQEPDDNATWPQYSWLVGHVMPSQIASSTDNRVREFAVNVVRYLYSSGDFKSARELAALLIEQWSQAGGDERHLLAVQRHLGIVIREQGEIQESYALNRRLLDRLRATLGEDDDETLLLLNSHGADLRFLGRFDEALAHDSDSLARHEDKFGPDHPRTLRAKNNLALDLLLLGDYTRAEALQNETYMAQEQAGSSKQNILASLNGLARVVRLSGRYREACDIGQDAYAYGLQELPGHPWTLRAAKDLSIALRRNGQVDEALDLARRTFDLQKNASGMAHPDSLAAALCLGNALRAAGAIEEALELLEETVKLYPRMYGNDHPFRYGCDMNLALLLRVNDQVGRARELDRVALDGFDARLTRDHHFTLTCAINLASDLAMLGETESARALGEGTLRRLRTLLGIDHPLTLACATNLVLDLQTVGETEQAAELREETMAAYERVLGPEHPDTLVAAQGGRIDFDFDPPVL
ncbi:FxSxx-COOH system tetratricopeptide repeat protein [Nonomuraea sp. NPDC050310]|uniref:FxSxx-COOH system tetratricopeptide repeat protein n=1 Tax=Nonomuraea sp. NPDC050310 TaxID=3154935 RepID=UPI0033F86E75